MTFQSLSFIVFFLCVVFTSFVVPKKLQNIVLVCFNFLFAYLAGGLKTLFFLLLSLFTTYLFALLLSKSKNLKYRKLLLLIPLMLNIGLLFFLKYTAFFTKNIPEIIRIISPIGISFYTLWMIGYLLDVYWKSYEPERNFFKYSAFASYFPLIISGPIVRYPQMQNELSKARFLTVENVSKGLLRMCWGFFQKMVISDNIGKLVNFSYGNYTEYSGLYIAFGTVCFALQLYTDFSGCMDIVLGCSKILGISLPENFDTPYFAKSISEYWRRWHITLGTWFKDYLMYPLLRSNLFVNIGEVSKKILGKKRAKKVPVYFSLVILWFTVGFWHGGLWKYIIGSGLLHCFYIISGQVFEKKIKIIKSKLHISDSNPLWALFQMVRTFILVCSGFVFFRSNGVIDALSLYKNMFLVSSNVPFSSFLEGSKVSFMRFILLILCVLLLFVVSLFRYRKASILKLYDNLAVNYILSLGLALGVVLFCATGTSSFIYFQF